MPTSRRLLSTLAGTVVLTSSGAASGEIEYLVTTQELSTFIQDGSDPDGNPVFVFEDHQSSLVPTGQSFRYLLEEPAVEAYLTSSLGLEFFTVDLVQNIRSGLEGPSFGKAGISFEFTVSETTTFEAAGSLSMLAGIPDARCHLRELGGSDLFDLIPSSDGNPNPFHFSGVLTSDSAYLLEFSIGADGNRMSSGSLSFQLTPEPIPEPEICTALAGVILAGFWCLRRQVI